MYRILVAEDNPIILQGIAESIDCGMNPVCVVATARDGDDAKRKITAHEPHILITDIRMPYCSGLELAQWLQEVSPGTQIIIISSYDDFSYAKRAVQLGCIDYILKPMDPAELNAAIGKAVALLREEAARTVDSVPILSACLYGDFSHIERLPEDCRQASFCVMAASSPTDFSEYEPALKELLGCTTVSVRESDCSYALLLFPSSEGLPDRILHAGERLFPPGVYGLSRHVADLTALPSARREAEKALLHGKLFLPQKNGTQIMSSISKSVPAPSFADVDPVFQYHYSGGEAAPACQRTAVLTC